MQFCTTSCCTTGKSAFIIEHASDIIEHGDGINKIFFHRLPPPKPEEIEEAMVDMQQGQLPGDQLVLARGIQRRNINRYFT